MNKTKAAIVIVMLFVLYTMISGHYPDYDTNYKLDPNYVLNAAGIDKQEYINGFLSGIKTEDDFALGDAYLILARLENNDNYYKLACGSFSDFKTEDLEEKAILYETLASLNCENKRKFYLEQAAEEWQNLNVTWRTELIKTIIRGKYLLEFDKEEIERVLNLSNKNEITIGRTKIEVRKEDKVITQVDRVYRDWLGEQMNQNPFRGKFLTTFSERLNYNKTELREDIGWHEGARMKDLETSLGLKGNTATGTIVARSMEKWYAPDENGIFKFEVPLDKISYPTTRFLTEDIAMIVDTHGVNMLVEQTIRKNANIILSDCDHPGKIKAALYLSENGKKVICFPDRFVYLALGHNANLLGSPVFRLENDKMIYGDAKITLERGQKIVVTDADVGKSYAIWYYTTPMLYFKEINKTFNLEIIPAVVDDFFQTEKSFNLARENNAKVIATRVFNSYDYNEAKKWLEENKENKIILFHSTMYPYAILLMQEFEGRISSDDPNPI
ncbi:hypothetical protein J4468_03575 [Candidatus Woesearchaeota archaeon]|nr:hypothetical protein [Candidatus Woesearchaeota archaeon]